MQLQCMKIRRILLIAIDLPAKMFLFRLCLVSPSESRVRSDVIIFRKPFIHESGTAISARYIPGDPS